MLKKNSITTILSIMLLSTLAASPPDWTPITGAQYSMILIADIQLDETTFPGDNENTAAAFGPNGENDCRSIGIWYPDDGLWYFTIRGNINNETINFRIYNESDDEIYLSEDTINFLNDTTIGSISTPHLISFSSPVSTLPAPENVILTLYPSSDFFILAWDEVPDADIYYIYSGDTPDISSATYLDQTINTNWLGFGIPDPMKFYWITSVSNSTPTSLDSNYMPSSSK